MLGQPRPQQDDENLTVNRSSRLHQVTAATAATAQRPLPSAESVLGELSAARVAQPPRSAASARLVLASVDGLCARALRGRAAIGDLHLPAPCVDEPSLMASACIRYGQRAQRRYWRRSLPVGITRARAQPGHHRKLATRHALLRYIHSRFG